jgi:hypothetical protein
MRFRFWLIIFMWCAGLLVLVVGAIGITRGTDGSEWLADFLLGIGIATAAAVLMRAWFKEARSEPWRNR